MKLAEFANIKFYARGSFLVPCRSLVETSRRRWKKIWHVINPKFNQKQNKINAEAQAEAPAEVVDAFNSASKLVERIIVFYQQTGFVLELVEGSILSSTSKSTWI